MTAMLIGHDRVCTNGQDLTGQKNALANRHMRYAQRLTEGVETTA